MKSLVVYYSFSGNTKKVAAALEEYLKQKGEVDLVELKATDESRNFFAQANRAFSKKRALLEPVNFDLSKYDLICFGTPIWAFSPTPAMNTYLDKCSSLADKDVILFSTYGSGTGNTKCLDYMQRILTVKGGKNFQRFSVQQGKVKDKNFILSEIKKLF